MIAPTPKSPAVTADPKREEYRRQLAQLAGQLETLQKSCEQDMGKYTKQARIIMQTNGSDAKAMADGLKQAIQPEQFDGASTDQLEALVIISGFSMQAMTKVRDDLAPAAQAVQDTEGKSTVGALLGGGAGAIAGVASTQTRTLLPRFLIGAGAAFIGMIGGAYLFSGPSQRAQRKFLAVMQEIGDIKAQAMPAMQKMMDAQAAQMNAQQEAPPPPPAQEPAPKAATIKKAPTVADMASPENARTSHLAAAQCGKDQDCTPCRAK